MCVCVFLLCFCCCRLKKKRATRVYYYLRVLPLSHEKGIFYFETRAAYDSSSIFFYFLKIIKKRPNLFLLLFRVRSHSCSLYHSNQFTLKAKLSYYTPRRTTSGSTTEGNQRHCCHHFHGRWARSNWLPWMWLANSTTRSSSL